MMRKIVVVGGSIAAVTAADSLRTNGYDGLLSVVSAESEPPYSRVPLSKGVLAGSQDPQSVWLQSLPEDVEVLLNARATGLNIQSRRVTLAHGGSLRYDGLVIATGAAARQLAAPGQAGELVVRDLADARAIAARAKSASNAVVVGAGFLGMEVASTLVSLGLDVTVIDREPPLERLLGRWLASFIVDTASSTGVRFLTSPSGVKLVGNPVEGVMLGNGTSVYADLIVTAAGDVPAVDWLSTSGLRIAGGLVIDGCCRAASGVVAAGDVTVQEVAPGLLKRTPHWTSAVEQARTAARFLLNPTDTRPYVSDPYFWTEQFGLDVKISGHLPLTGSPLVVAGDPADRTALLQWSSPTGSHAAVAINYRIPVIKLKKMRGLTLSRH
ncbi:NAD(P)/FAD-dependent oxidoreductase [Rhodococcoides fascians]|nr:FAD-dependent oxidoreductase [Rhodococcus fascians]